MKKSSVASILPALILAGFTSNVSGAGFAIAEQSVKGLGSAFSGGAASADDASTVWFNPAGMTQFSGTHVSQAIHGIFPKAKFNNNGSTTNPLLGGAPLSGSNFDGPKDAIVPNLYVTHSLNERMVVGLGMNAPFGLVTDHDKDFVGRYHALRSDVATVNINPSFAFKVNNQFSVGFGVSAQYIDVKLSNAVDMTGTCLGLTAGGFVAPGTCGALGLGNPANIATVGTDSEARVEGDDWSWGYNFGFIYEPTEGTRLGAHYRSRINHDLTGAAEFFHTHPGAAGLAAGLAAGGVPLLSNQPISASLDLPESVSLSAYREVNSQWSIQTDITWMKWKRFQELRIDFASPSRPDAVTPFEWENTIRFALGSTYKLNDKISLRGGVALDKTPITSPELRTPRIADEDRVWVAVGGSYSFSESASLDIGYTHIFISDPEIDFSTGPHSAPSLDNPLPETILVGDYDAAVDIFSVQFNMEF